MKLNLALEITPKWVESIFYLKLLTRLIKITLLSLEPRYLVVWEVEKVMDTSRRHVITTS